LSNKCPPDYDGGYELSAFQVAGALRDRGYDVHLATSHYRPTFKGNRSDPDWVHRIFAYLEWPALTKKRLARSMEDARRVADLTNVGVDNADALHAYLKKESFDLAYCFGLHGIGLATAFPLAARKMPILWHAGNYLIAQDLQLRSLWKRHRLAQRIGMHLMSRKAKLMIQRGDYSHIAFLSEAMQREFVRMGYKPPHSYIIPRGIDFPLSDLQEDRSPAFLMASRVAEEKGYDVVLEACGTLAKQSPITKWELHIAGSGRPEYIESLKAKARHEGIEDRVRFLGMLKRDEVLEEMRHSYAFISASLWEEPFGRTNIEALACGAPLVAADTGAIREIVGDSECALIYPKHDAAALARNLQDILGSSQLRGDLAHKGVDRIQKAFTMDRILDLTENVIAQVMKDYGKPIDRPHEEAIG
jgi:glycosyltransferase involved in cell wall biosynthesis